MIFGSIIQPKSRTSFLKCLLPDIKASFSKNQGDVEFGVHSLILIQNHQLALSGPRYSSPNTYRGSSGLECRLEILRFIGLAFWSPNMGPWHESDLEGSFIAIVHTSPINLSPIAMTTCPYQSICLMFLAEIGLANWFEG